MKLHMTLNDTNLPNGFVSEYVFANMREAKTFFVTNMDKFQRHKIEGYNITYVNSKSLKDYEEVFRDIETETRNKAFLEMKINSAQKRLDTMPSEAVETELNTLNDQLTESTGAIETLKTTLATKKIFNCTGILVEVAEDFQL